MHLALGPDCSNEVITERTSPDGRYVAIVFDRGCGATTSNERIVMIQGSKDSLKPNDYTAWVFTAKYEPQIELRWVDKAHLVVSSSSNDESPKPVEQWHDVSIIRVYSG